MMNNPIFGGAGGAGVPTAGAGGIMGGIMGGMGGAYQQPQNTINWYTQQGQNQLNPFIQAGQGAANGLAGTQAMYQNPIAAYNKFTSQYQMSPGAQAQMKNGMSAIQNAMAQYGLGGSGHEMQALSQYTQGLINQDMNSQWNNILNGQRMGLEAGSTLYGGGVDSAGRAAGLYGQAGEDIAGLQEAQIAAQMAQQQQDNSDLLGGIGAVGGMLFGGGNGGGFFGSGLF